MAKSNPQSKKIPAIISAIGKLIGDHQPLIASITGVVALLITILNVVFGIHFVPYGDAFLSFVTSSSFISALLFCVLITQILMFQRVEGIIFHLEENHRTEAYEEVEEETVEKEALTDGGQSTNQPRDSQGRFKSKDSGGSNILLMILAGATGYVIAAEFGGVDPIVGALLGIMFIALYKS